MKRSLVCLLSSLGIAWTLSACSSNPPQAASPGVAATLNTWKGRRVTDAVSLWGMPDSIGREGTVGVLVWKADNAAGKPSFPPLPGSMEWVILCTRVLTVDPSETIVAARAYGSDCSMNPEDYAPPP